MGGELCRTADVTARPGTQQHLLAPIESQQAWPAGVTYERSREARTIEAGGADFYDRIYTADRPETFLEATRTRTVGPGGHAVFQGSTPTAHLSRSLAEPYEHLGRCNGYPVGAILLTGTSVVPPDEDTLAANGVVVIGIEGAAELTNTVTTVPARGRCASGDEAPRRVGGRSRSPWHRSRLPPRACYRANENGPPPVPIDATKRATLHDVAALARVSHQTVSRVINDHPNVAPATRDRVNTAIRNLGYRRNATARNLVTRRSHTVGIVSHGINFYGPSQMLVNIETSFRSRGYGLTLSSVPSLSAQGLTAAITEVRSREVEGIVMITPVVRTDIAAVKAACSGIPFVMIDINLGGNVPSVVIDQRRGGELTGEHLIQHGHRRIAVVRGPSAWTGSVLRHAGLTEALKRAGIAPVFSEAGDWTPASGYRIAQRLLARGVPFTAVVAGNDEMALGVVRALHEHGLRVPNDVSVTGFDDVPSAAYFQPPLTTVHQDFAELGTRAATFLIDLVTDTAPTTSQHVLTPRLVVRGSTGPAPDGVDG